MDIDKILNNEVFKNIEPERLEAFKKLSAQLEGKSQLEAMGIVMEFQKKMPQGKKLTKEENQAMLMCVMEALPDQDRKKFMDIIQMLGRIQGQ